MNLHVVIGDNRYTQQLLDRLNEKDNGIIVIADPKYKGIKRGDGVTYVCMSYVKEVADLHEKIYVYTCTFEGKEFKRWRKRRAQ
ncbi:hypothetical protein [Sporosarcina limicola]|uniref:Uncharacterized protein n=1 Tax=Sporosarcina limicola TaxID=34101 RepID=A0A927MP49_9BACL|nr:hypothetical protein [Sporosarcina limicola]MBE1556437.1 hypothetical protein [Sporosarcina limicola]